MINIQTSAFYSLYLVHFRFAHMESDNEKARPATGEHRGSGPGGKVEWGIKQTLAAATARLDSDNKIEKRV